MNENGVGFNGGASLPRLGKICEDPPEKLREMLAEAWCGHTRAVRPFATAVSCLCRYFPDTNEHGCGVMAMWASGGLGGLVCGVVWSGGSVEPGAPDEPDAADEAAPTDEQLESRRSREFTRGRVW
jgi:hypothetical protein